MTAFENPYRPHKYNRRQFSKKDCCGAVPQRSGMELYCHSVATGDWAWQPLYQCPVCGRYWLRFRDAFLEIDNPLRWEHRQDHSVSSEE